MRFRLITLVNSLVLGAGYAGLNAYYNIRGSKTLISRARTFTFYTAMLRNLVRPTKYTTSLGFVIEEEVKEIDVDSKTIKTNRGKYEADNIVVSLGCVREGMEKLLEKAKNEDHLVIGSEDMLDEYLALQIAFYAKRLGKDVKYSGSPLSWLGKNVEEKVTYLLGKYGISVYEKANLVVPRCRPPDFFDFAKVNENLEVKEGVYVVGDLIYGWPKLGELAMRTGRFVGRRINGHKERFEPVFIFILDTGMGEGLHIRSKVPWGNPWNVAKVSRVRPLMKRFIEKYYILRKGNMGFLFYL